MKRVIKKPALWTVALALFLAPILCCCLTKAAAAAPAVTQAESAHTHCHKEEAPQAAAPQDEAGCGCHQLSTAPSADNFILVPPANFSGLSAAVGLSTLSEVGAHREYLNLSFLSPPVLENRSPIYLTLANFRL